MKLPSKELMSEVLNEKVLSIKPYNEDKFYKNVIMYECRKGVHDIININKLTHLMVVWAMSFKYFLKPIYIKASNYDKEDNSYFYITVVVYKENDKYRVFHVQEPTSFDAVVNICEWILKQESTKPLSTCCSTPFIEESEMYYPHDGVVGQCSKCMEMSEQRDVDSQ